MNTWNPEPPADETLSLADERRALALLAEAAPLDEEAREALLAASDPVLERQVRALLAAGRGGGASTTGTPTSAGSGGEAAGELLPPGTELGPYRILRALGAGGMGQVYLAAQREPIERRVALKVLQLGAAQPWARRRFSAERRAMARLDHPNVAKILDAGTAADGTLYLAMERIEGVAITTYCDDNRLSIGERLGLFTQVCRGVEHAHHKFLLHRDIKPSNVLIAEVDGRPVPKLIDFGIAEILDASFADAARADADDGKDGAPSSPRVIGTPRYMSPEALGLGGEVDTRSDVYSLGVLLYELLAGRRPWQGDDASLAAVVSRHRSGSPPPPSTVGEDLTQAARRRGEASAPRLARHLRGDLDAIVLKALAAEPEARYESAAVLAEDVERYLAHRPVAARPAGTVYRFRRALRRHRTAAVAAGLVLVALLAGTAGTVRGMLRAREAEGLARQEAAQAHQARQESEQVVAFLTQLFAASDPNARDSVRSPSEITAVELLERGAQRIEEELADQPRVAARLEETIGHVYLQLGIYDAAEGHLRRSVDLQQELADAERRLLANTHVGLAMVYVNLDEPADARRELDLALTALAESEEPEDLKLRADVFNNLGRQQRVSGELEASEESFRRAIGLYTQVSGADDLELAGAVANLGVLFFNQDRWADAEAQFRRALPILRAKLPPGHMRTAVVNGNLAAAVASQGRLAEAAPIFESVLADQRAILGDDHPRVGAALNNLGVLYQQLGEPEKAVAYHRQALALRERTLGPDHPSTAWSLDNLARALDDLGRADEALPLQRRALVIREARETPDPLQVARSVEHLAHLAMKREDYAAALPLAERTLELRRDALPEGDSRLGEDAVRVGECLWHLGRRDEARQRFGEGIELLEGGGEPSADELAAARRAIDALGAG